MERVETLSKMLAEKIVRKASYDDILVTVKMIESELLHLKIITPTTKYDEKLTTTVDIFKTGTENSTNSNQEKIIETLYVDEKEIEEELDEIKHNIAHLSFMAAKNKPAFKIDDETDEKLSINDLHSILVSKEVSINEVPFITTAILETKATEKNEPIITLPKEVNEVIHAENIMSINERLNQQQHELSDKLKDTPIEDLKKAIGVNERFLYLNELFRGDDVMYDKSIKTINAFGTYEDAELWIRKELKLRLGWDDNYNTVKQFYELVRRRFT